MSCASTKNKKQCHLLTILLLGQDGKEVSASPRKLYQFSVSLFALNQPSLSITRVTCFNKDNKFQIARKHIEILLPDYLQKGNAVWEKMEGDYGCCARFKTCTLVQVGCSATSLTTQIDLYAFVQGRTRAHLDISRLIFFQVLGNSSYVSCCFIAVVVLWYEIVFYVSKLMTENCGWPVLQAIPSH